MSANHESGPGAPVDAAADAGAVADAVEAGAAGGSGVGDPAVGDGLDGGTEPGSSQTGSGDIGATDAGEAVEADLRLASLARERDDYLDALRRLQADFENYKKRMLKQQTDYMERAAVSLVEKLLPVLDTVDLAVAHGGGQSVEQIWTALNDTLAQEGLERIDPMGEVFDPTQHDAVMHEPGEGEAEVADVMRAGYRWKGRVLRPAMVKVRGS